MKIPCIHFEKKKLIVNICCGRYPDTTEWCLQKSHSVCTSIPNFSHVTQSLKQAHEIDCHLKGVAKFY